jgi:hypothetical protein
MPAVICQGSYAGLYMLNAMCYVSNLICQLQYVCIYMSAHECLIFPISCQVSLYANLDCFMSNYYISVCMPNALCHILYAECNGLYAKLHMLDCYMPNTMTIAMSFSMTTEQVGYLNIYICLLPGYDSPYCRYRGEITIISPWLQFISQLSGI